MITPISTNPAPIHRSKEKLPRHDGAFGCVDSGEAVASSSDIVGLEVEVADAETLAVSVGVAVSAGSVAVLTGVSVGEPAVSVAVTSVVCVAVDFGRVACVAVDFRVASGVAV